MELSKDAWVFVFLLALFIFPGMMGVIRDLVKPKLKPEPEPKLSDPNWDPLAEMLQGGESQPVDSKRVIEWISGIAADANNWSKDKNDGYSPYDTYECKFAPIRILISLSGFFRGIVQINKQNCEFIDSVNQQKICNAFTNALEQEKERKRQELGQEQMKSLAQLIK